MGFNRGKEMRRGFFCPWVQISGSLQRSLRRSVPSQLVSCIGTLGLRRSLVLLTVVTETRSKPLVEDAMVEEAL